MEKHINYNNSKLTMEKALQMLKSEGLDASVDQVEEILYFLRKIVNIALIKHLSETKTNKIANFYIRVKISAKQFESHHFFDDAIRLLHENMFGANMF